MQAGLNNTEKFQKIKDIQTPDIFARRFKTGLSILDNAFCADGWVPGCTFTINGTPGSGKTTLLCQLLQGLAEKKKNVAYISGEESVNQLAFNCKRIGATDIFVANMNDLKKVQEAVECEKFDFIILDSFPCFFMPGMFRTTKDREHAAVECIISTAHTNNCVVGCVLHVTKTGTYKGSTLLPHAVDANYSLTRDENESNIRYLEAMKNRFGTSTKTTFNMTQKGFSFDTKRDVKIEQKNYDTLIMDFVEKQKILTIEDALRLCGTQENATTAIRDCIFSSRLRFGRSGKESYWFKA